MLSLRVCWFAPEQEVSQAICDIILALDDPVCQLVVASNASTLIRCVPQSVQGAGVRPVHYQQLHLHDLPGQGSNVERGGATLRMHVVRVRPVRNQPEAGLQVAGTRTSVELLGTPDTHIDRQYTSANGG